MEAHLLKQGEGERSELGIVSVRLLVSGDQTDGRLGVMEFRGGDGPWTVPHIHEAMEESFYVLEGSFDFTVGNNEFRVEPGAFLIVPRGTPHAMTAHEGGGALLALFLPGGLEEMFMELGRLPADSITDPQVRAEIGKRYDSIQV